MARIRHIAIRTPDPEKTAAFYKDVFGLKEVGQARTGCYLSDGHINLAILKARDEGGPESPRDAAGYAGIHHLGFMVDDAEETYRKLESAGATPMTPQNAQPNHFRGTGPRSYYEVKYRGPDAQEIDVTESGWIGAE
jgi:catechol 2,3-dioxygenase-like lactoylglutathione lyase family enzyme